VENRLPRSFFFFLPTRCNIELRAWLQIRNLGDALQRERRSLIGQKTCYHHTFILTTVHSRSSADQQLAAVRSQLVIRGGNLGDQDRRAALALC
jgi:hypothetical protein